MEAIINSESERLAFIDLISRKLEVTIPMIQRDYAQGRTSHTATKIRKEFVEELHTKIIGNIPLSLDFVYGSISCKRFIPLDGQQRLTTLFLLHIYLEGVVASLHDDSESRPQPLDYKFSYETRDSSKRFCDEIINHRFEIFDKKELSKSVEENSGNKKNKKFQTPSMIIKNQNWWFGIWADDPTVSGMLNMLDEIHKVFFGDAEIAYRALFDSQKQAVSFRFMPLKDFYDPDDLYMKMNARGLPLTPFEIFKSRFYSDLKDNLDDASLKLAKSNIDVKYTDFLWPMRAQGMKNIDVYFQRIFQLLIATEHVALSNSSDKKWLDHLFEANDKTYDFSHNQFLKMGVNFSKNLIDRILEDLELLCTESSPFHQLRAKSPISKWMDADGLWTEMIEQDSISKPTYRQRLELYALLRFMANFPNADFEKQLPTWARLIHNLTEATALDNSDKMASAIRNIDNLIDSLKQYNGATDVNDWVSAKMDLSNRFFSDFQWEEEVIKAQLRKDPSWDIQISRAEANRYLKGEIGFTLWLAGVISEKSNKSFTPQGANLGEFTKYLDKAIPLLGQIADAGSATIKNYALVRAMLNKGDYMPWSTSWRKNIYNQPNHRDYSWKALWRIHKNSHLEALTCLKEVLDDSDYDTSDVYASLDKISSHRLPKGISVWRRLLTSKIGQKILSGSHQGFIAFTGDQSDYNKKNVLIYGSSQRNGWHGELCSLVLFYLLKEKGVNPSYYWQKDTNSDYGIFFKDKNGNIVSIYYWDGYWYLENYNKPDFTNLTDLRKYILSKI